MSENKTNVNIETPQEGLPTNAEEKNKVLALQQSLNPKKEVKDDGGLKTRSDIYNSILSDYQKSIHDTLVAKKVYKIITYIIVSLILIAITTTTIILFFMYSNLEMVEWLAIVIPVMISFLATFIIIPQIITNYLFDKNEETHMTELLKILIEYDRNFFDS